MLSRETPCSGPIGFVTDCCYYSRRLIGCREWYVSGYVAKPLSDYPIVGHMGIIHDKPMAEDPGAFDLIQIFAARAAAALKRRRAEAGLQAALEQVQALQQRLQAENIYLQEEIRTQHNFEEIVGRGPSLFHVLKNVEAVAPTDTTVLITGESDCGKS